MSGLRSRIRRMTGVAMLGILAAGAAGRQSSLRGGLSDAERVRFRSDALSVLTYAAECDDPVLTANAIEALGEAAPAEGTAVIAKNLDTGNRMVTFAALTALGTAGRTEQLERFRTAAGDADPSVRIGAIYAMHRCGDKSRTGELGALLTSDPKPMVRANAALVLGRMGEPGAARLLNAALSKEKDEITRRNMLEALVMLRDRKAMDTMMAYGYSAEAGQAVTGLMALANARCKEAEGIFVDRLNRAEAPEVRLLAARGLGRIGYQGMEAEQAFDLALAHLFFRTPKAKDPSEPGDVQIRRVRALAALALEALGRADALRSLRAAFDASGQSDYVRVAVGRAALSILGGRSGDRRTTLTGQ